MNVRHAYDVYRGYRVPHLQLIEHRRWWRYAAIGILGAAVGAAAMLVIG